MRYEDFKQQMIEKIAMSVPCDTNVSVKAIRKNNGIILDAVNITGPGESITPTFYLTHYFDLYQKGMPMESLAEDIVFDWSCFGQREIRTKDIISKDAVRSGVRFRIVNYDMNAVQLREIPHRKYLDLAMVFYYKVNEKILPDASILISHEMLTKMGIGEVEIYQHAVENTVREQPPVLEKLSNIVSGGFSERDLSDEESELYVLTNREGLYGAGTLFYPDTGTMLRDRFRKNLLLIPSSVHEWIIIPETMKMGLGEINDLICEVNEVMVCPDEILSSHAYLYEYSTMHLGFQSY